MHCDEVDHIQLKIEIMMHGCTVLLFSAAAKFTCRMGNLTVATYTIPYIFCPGREL